MVMLIWPDGAVTTGSGWRDAERAVREDRWQRAGPRWLFRREMRRRARLWCGRRVLATGTSRQFLSALADVGMFALYTFDA